MPGLGIPLFTLHRSQRVGLPPQGRPEHKLVKELDLDDTRTRGTGFNLIDFPRIDLAETAHALRPTSFILYCHFGCSDLPCSNSSSKHAELPLPRGEMVSDAGN